MKTTCEHCVFRENSTTENGIVQTGCKLYLLDKFDKEQKVNDKDSFFVINDWCRHCRNENWYFLKEHPEASFTRQKLAVFNENCLNYAVIIAHKDIDTRESLYETIDSLQDYPAPSFISIYTNLTVGEAKSLYMDIAARTKIPFAVNVSTLSSDYDDLLSIGSQSKFAKEPRQLLFIVSGNVVNKNSLYVLNTGMGNGTIKAPILALYEYYYIADRELAKHVGFHTIDIVDAILGIAKQENLQGHIIDETESRYSHSKL